MSMRNDSASKTRMVRQALQDSGYSARVHSTAKTRSLWTVVDMIEPARDMDNITIYLAGYLGDDAKVTQYESFISVTWKG